MASERLKEFNFLQDRKIGRGSFGEVFLMAHKQTGKQYVLKKVRLSRLNEWQRNASHTEMRLAQELHHPFVVPHFNSWVDRGHTIHMVHEYCANGDLNSLLQQQKGSGFHEDELRLWLAECLLALEYIHSQGVIHRDLKPSNLFLTDSRDILIGDFGLATYRRGEPNEDHSFVGTAQYMSPEIVSNEPHGFETDIWSLGCCFWELSSGKAAFQAFNLEGLEKKIIQGQVSALPKHHTSEWVQLLRSMLVRNPARRATVSSLLQDPCMHAATGMARARRGQLAGGMGIPPSPHVHNEMNGDLMLADSASMSHPSEAATEITRSTSINSDLDSAMTPAQPSQAVATGTEGGGAGSTRSAPRRPVVPPLRLESRFSATDDSPPPSNRSVTADSLRSSETAALHGAHRLSLGSMYSTEGPECVFYEAGVPVLRSPRRRSAVTDPGTSTKREAGRKAPGVPGHQRPALTPRNYTPRGTTAIPTSARRSRVGGLTPRDSSPRKGSGQVGASRKAVVPRPGLSPRVASPRKAATPRGMPPWGVGTPRGTATPRDTNTPRGGRSPTKRTVTAAVAARAGRNGGGVTPRNRPTPRGNVSPRARPTPRGGVTPRTRGTPKSEQSAQDAQSHASRASSQLCDTDPRGDRLTPRDEVSSRGERPPSSGRPAALRSATPPHVRLTPRQIAVRRGVDMPRSATPPRGMRTEGSGDGAAERLRSGLHEASFERQGSSASVTYARSPLMQDMHAERSRSFNSNGLRHKTPTDDSPGPTLARCESTSRTLSAVSEPLPACLAQESAQAVVRARASASAALSAAASTNDDRATDSLARAGSQDIPRWQRSVGASALPRFSRGGSSSPSMSTASEAQAPFELPLQQVPEEEEEARDVDNATAGSARGATESSKLPTPNLAVPRPIPAPRPKSAHAAVAGAGGSIAPSDSVFAWGSPDTGMRSSPARPNVARRALKSASDVYRRLAEAATVSSSRRSRSRNGTPHEGADTPTARSKAAQPLQDASVASGGTRFRTPSPATSHGSGMTFRTEPGRKPSPFVASGGTGKSHRAATVRSSSPRRARSRGSSARGSVDATGQLHSPLRRTKSGVAGDAAAASLEERLRQRGIANPWTAHDSRNGRMKSPGSAHNDRHARTTQSVLALLPPRSGGGSGGSSRTIHPKNAPRQPSSLSRKSIDGQRSRQLQLPRPTTAPATAGAAVVLPRSPSLTRGTAPTPPRGPAVEALQAARPERVPSATLNTPSRSSTTPDTPRSPSLAGDASLSVRTPPHPLKPSASSSSAFSPTLPFTPPSTSHIYEQESVARSPDKLFGCMETYAPVVDLTPGLRDTMAAMDYAGLDGQDSKSADLAPAQTAAVAESSAMGASSSFASTPHTARAFLHSPQNPGASTGTPGKSGRRSSVERPVSSPAGQLTAVPVDESWHVYQPWMSSTMSWPQSGDVDAETPGLSQQVQGRGMAASPSGQAAQKHGRPCTGTPRRPASSPRPLKLLQHSVGEGQEEQPAQVVVPWNGGARAPLDSDEHMKLHSAGERQKAAAHAGKRRKREQGVLPMSPCGLQAHEAAEWGEHANAFDPTALRKTDVMKEREAAWGRSPTSSRTASRSPDKRDHDGRGRAMEDTLALAVLESLQHIRTQDYMLAEATLEGAYQRYMRRLSVRKRFEEESSFGIGSSGVSTRGKGIGVRAGPKKGAARSASAKAPRRRASALDDPVHERPHRSSSASRLPQYATMSPRPPPASATRRRAEERAEDQRAAKQGRPPKAPEGARRSGEGADRVTSGEMQPLPIRQGTVDELEAHRKGGPALVAAGKRLGEAADIEAAAARTAAAASAIEDVSRPHGPVTQVSMTDERASLTDATCFSVMDSQLLDESLTSGFDAETMQAMLSRIDAEVAAMPGGQKSESVNRQGPQSSGPSSYGQRLEARAGDMVRVGAVPAVVRYVGPVATLGPGSWVGLELSMACGTCDGTLNGVEYFKCGQKCGAFIAATALSPDNDDSFAMDL